MITFYYTFSFSVLQKKSIIFTFIQLSSAREMKFSIFFNLKNLFLQERRKRKMIKGSQALFSRMENN